VSRAIIGLGDGDGLVRDRPPALQRTELRILIKLPPVAPQPASLGSAIFQPRLVFDAAGTASLKESVVAAVRGGW
jgi:hypothetical protein